MSTLPSKTSKFTSTDELNAVLSQTLSQTKQDLQQLTHLTKKKWGKKAIMFQQRVSSLPDHGDKHRIGSTGLTHSNMRKGDSFHRRLHSKRSSSSSRNKPFDGSSSSSPRLHADEEYTADDLYVPSSSRYQDPDSMESTVRRTRRKRRDIVHGGPSADSKDVFIPLPSQSSPSGKVQRDYELLSQLIETLKEKERQRKKKGYTKAQFTEVYDRTKQLLEELWKEMHIPHRERVTFGRLAFGTKTIRNCVLIFDEISRLCKIRSLQHDVITKIEQREVFIKRLHRLDLSARNGTNSDTISEMSNVLHSLRITSLGLVELIQQWRQMMKAPTTFSWKDENYILKMRSDLNWLQVSSFSTYLPFSVEDNPLLLPLHMRAEFIRKRVAERRSKNNSNSNPPPIFVVEESVTPKSPTQTPFSPNSLIGQSNSQIQPSWRQRSTIDSNSHPEDVAELPKIIMKPIDSLTKEDLSRFQKVEHIMEQEDEYIESITEFEHRNHAATKIQTCIRAMLARKVARQKKKEKRASERHRRRVIARMEEEQQLRKEENRLQKKLSVSQLISSIDEDSTFSVPSSVHQHVGQQSENQLNLSVDDTLFKDDFMSKYNKSGKYKASLGGLINLKR